MSRVLGIDFGRKRVGIAVTDPLQIIASPLEVVLEKDFKHWLKAYLEKEDVVTIVLGFPRRLNGDDTHITKDVLLLEGYLKEEYSNLKIVLVDERLTSKMARQSLIDSGVPKNQRKKKGSLDSVSASLILQTYLTSIND